jgi:cytochrome P450
MTKLEEFAQTTDALAQNRLLFGWLSDDEDRAGLYKELESNDYPGLRFKSLLRTKTGNAWQMDEAFLVSRPTDVEAALRHYSVEPYSKLGSGGRFMLGLDDIEAHRIQRGAAAAALRYEKDVIRRCAEAAFRRVEIQYLKKPDFDLAVLAEQAALNFMKLLFGFRDEAHGILERAMDSAYRALVYTIIGRHFVPASEAKLPALGSHAVEKGKRLLNDELQAAVQMRGDEPFRNGAPPDPVIKRLDGKVSREELEVIVPGLVAGTIGNVRAAVPIVISDFFAQRDEHGVPLIDAAQRAARDEGPRLKELIESALLRNPPAAFLARTSRALPAGVAPLTYQDGSGRVQPIPDGAHVLLAIGAPRDPKLIFGGTPTDFMHQCVGEHLARPLIEVVVGEVLKLPGLSREIDPDSGSPKALEKRWGVMCDSLPMRYQRGRRLNQQPLFVVLPIKEPVKQNADILKRLTRFGAHVVEESLQDSGIVHFAWFMLVENETKLALSTVYDGDFDAYVEYFASKVPLFDEQFKYLAVDQRTPIAEFPKEFVETIRKYNRAPLEDYFFSAYPLVSTARVHNAAEETP